MWMWAFCKFCKITLPMKLTSFTLPTKLTCFTLCSKDCCYDVVIKINQYEVREIQCQFLYLIYTPGVRIYQESATLFWNLMPIWGAGNILCATVHCKHCNYLMICFENGFSPRKKKSLSHILARITMWTHFCSITLHAEPNFLTCFFSCQEKNEEYWLGSRKKKGGQKTPSKNSHISHSSFSEKKKKNAFPIAFLPNVCKTKLFFFFFLGGGLYWWAFSCTKCTYKSVYFL